MIYRKWLMITLSLILIFVTLVVAVNLCIDHHGVRLSLFSGQKQIHQSVYPDGLSQQIFNPEIIFRSPTKFDSFLFGSSRTAVIHAGRIPGGRFYNMSYPLGLPVQHLAILKAFLRKGIKIRNVAIGLDEFCFSLTAQTGEKQLNRMMFMHPDAGGPSRLKIFDLYFFRKPDLRELSLWKDRVLLGKGKLVLNGAGDNLGWRDREKILEETGRPIFDFSVKSHEPIDFGRQETDEAFAVIKELIDLSRIHHFRLTFFINPFYRQTYLNSADALLPVKERLAQLTDYYDFSGFNSVTMDPMNYYEESHYRYRVGDMIIARIFGGKAKLPDDFGVMVTRQNICGHLENQKRELEAYLKAHHLR